MTNSQQKGTFNYRGVTYRIIKTCSYDYPTQRPNYWYHIEVRKTFLWVIPYWEKWKTPYRSCYPSRVHQFWHLEQSQDVHRLNKAFKDQIDKDKNYEELVQLAKKSRKLQKKFGKVIVDPKELKNE